MAVCNHCQTPIPGDTLRRYADGEYYHPRCWSAKQAP